MLNEAPMAGVRQRVLTLRSFDGLERLDVDALTLMAEHASYRRFRSGAVIQRESQVIDTIHLVVDGALRVERYGKRIAEVGRGEAAGVLSVLARDSHGVSAVALRDTTTLALPADVFLAAYEENFSLMRNSLRLSAIGILERRRDLPASPAHAHAPLGKRRDHAMTLAEHVIALRRTPLFGGSNVDATLEVARHLQPVRLEAGEELWALGDPSMYSVRVDYGRVACRNEAGEEVTVGSGFLLGILHALADRPRGFSATAVTEVMAYRSDLETFLAVLETHFSLAMDLQALLAGLLLEDENLGRGLTARPEPGG